MIFKEYPSKDGNILLTIKFNKENELGLLKRVKSIIENTSVNLEEVSENAIVYLKKMPKLIEACSVDLDAVIDTLDNVYGIVVENKTELKNLIQRAVDYKLGDEE